MLETEHLRVFTELVRRAQQLKCLGHHTIMGAFDYDHLVLSSMMVVLSISSLAERRLERSGFIFVGVPLHARAGRQEHSLAFLEGRRRVVLLLDKLAVATQIESLTQVFSAVVIPR